MLLLVSFIYTDNVFKEARKTDPVMTSIINYKEKQDIKAKEPTILGDEMILGVTGLIVDEKKSYKNMKEENIFDEDKLVYEITKPKINLSNTYDYYIKKGNTSSKKMALIIKVNEDSNVSKIIDILKDNNISIAFFVDGSWLEKNTNDAFEINRLGCEIYNLGYKGKYTKNKIEVTNNLIQSITLKNSLFCLNENKIDEEKEICKNKKMHTIIPSVSNPSISELKKYIEKGNIIVYDIDTFNYDNFNLIINTITSRGYVIDKLSRIISEDNN